MIFLLQMYFWCILWTYDHADWKKNQCGHKPVKKSTTHNSTSAITRPNYIIRSPQARELGGDYVSIRSDNDRSKAPPGSRLVRDDDGSDEEEGRLHVRGLDLPSDKPKRKTYKERKQEYIYLSPHRHALDEQKY